MYRVIWIVTFLTKGVENVTRIEMRQSHQTRDSHSMLQLRWANIETVLGEWHMFAGVLPLSIQQTQCWSSVWASVIDDLSALNQQWAMR